MKDNELTNLRKTYMKMTGDRDRLKSIEDRMKELEANPLVKEYKKLSEEYKGYHGFYRDDIVGRTDNDILCRLARTGSITPTTNVYFYAATQVKCSDGETDYVDEASEDDVVLLYLFKKAETGHNEFTRILPDELEEFVKDNIVIYPTNKYDSGTFYQDANEYFIAKEISEGEEKALEEFKQYALKGYPWNVL